MVSGGYEGWEPSLSSFLSLSWFAANWVLILPKTESESTEGGLICYCVLVAVAWFDV